MPRVIGSILFAMCLAGCAALGVKGSLPVDQRKLYPALPQGYEVRFAVQLREGELSESYLLAVSSRIEAIRMMVVTPQGLPVYEVQTSVEGTQLQWLSPMRPSLTPDKVAQLMLMVYGKKEEVRSALNSGWTLQSVPGSRVYRFEDHESGQIDVVYEGEYPWYREVQVIEPAKTMTIKIRTLEADGVLP